MFIPVSIVGAVVVIGIIGFIFIYKKEFSYIKSEAFLNVKK